MSKFNENKQLLVKLLKGRQYVLQELNTQQIWMEDEMQESGKSEVIVSVEEKPNWLKVANALDTGMFGFISIDGARGVFRNSSPPVKDETPFKYLKTYFIAPTTGERKQRIETAGPCDCLIIDRRWRFFEFKTKAETQDINQADENRIKGELQLARTLTFFREQATDKNLDFPADCDCVLVTVPSFPSIKAKLINRAVKFNALFQAPLTEIQTDKIYSLA